MFLIDRVMPNGAQAHYHKVQRIEVVGEAIHATVNSYHLPEMAMISWQDVYVIPPPFVVESVDQAEALLVLPGAPFEGGSVVAPEPATLAEAQARAWAEVKARRQQLEQTGSAPTPFGLVQCDDASKIKISGLVQMALIAQAAEQPFSQTFTLTDNSVVTLYGGEVIALGVAVGTHVAALHAYSQTLRAQIEACETAEEVAALDLNASWQALLDTLYGA